MQKRKRRVKEDREVKRTMREIVKEGIRRWQKRRR